MARAILINRYFHPDESATAMVLTDLAAHLGQKHNVIVLCSRQRQDQPQANLPAEARLNGVFIRRLWSTCYGRARLLGRTLDYLSFLASVGAWLLLHLRRGDMVLAKTDPPLLGVVAALAALGRRISLVHWHQDVYPETAWRLGVSGETSWIGQTLVALRNWSLRRGRLNVVVSPGMGAHLQRAARITPPCVIPNWADDLRGLERSPPPSSYRAELALENKLIIGYSGNLGRAHPIGGLIALARVLREDRNYHFFFTGGGAHFEALRSQIESEGILNWSFLSYQPRERLPELLRTADLHLVLLDPRLERFVFPSKIYGILAAGRPVLHLGDPTGEVAQLLGELNCGWSLAAEATEELRELLVRLRQHPSERLQTGLRARQAYDQRFSKEQALGRWMSALAPLLR